MLTIRKNIHSIEISIPAHPQLRRILHMGIIALMLLSASLGRVWGMEGELHQNDPGFSIILTYAAQVKVVTALCRDDAPHISGHLIQAYDAWWERNTVIRKTIRGLEFGLHAEQAAESREVLESLKSRAEAIYVEKRKTDPEEFARECNFFIKGLAAGDWDYPKAKRLSR